MKLANYLKKHESTTEERIAEQILGFEHGEKRDINVYLAYEENNLTVLKFIDRESGLWGFLRDDNSGWSGFTCFTSHDDELSLAAQNADFDVLKLKRKGDGIDWKYILKLAKENKWGEVEENYIAAAAGL